MPQGVVSNVLSAVLLLVRLRIERLLRCRLDSGLSQQRGPGRRGFGGWGRRDGGSLSPLALSGSCGTWGGGGGCLPNAECSGSSGIPQDIASSREQTS